MLIQHQPLSRLGPAQQLALARTAFAHQPTAAMRGRLAAQLRAQDAFEEIITLSACAADADQAELGWLAEALLARDTDADNQQACAVAERALALAETDARRSAHLALRAKAEKRLGQQTAARATLVEALRLDPANKDACKRLASLDLAMGRPEMFLAMAGELAAAGVRHSRLYAAKALAEARLGDGEGARATIGLPSLLYRQNLAPPTGWDTIESFNQALAAELLAHPNLRYKRYGTASQLSWRIDEPRHRAAPLCGVLIDHLITLLSRQCAALHAAGHPWLAARPAKGTLKSWCVITDGDGHESWHVHQAGWMSGVYYVQVPAAICADASPAGFIGFGLPAHLAGEEASARHGEALVRPEPGLMLTFPSHCYHRTFPHGGADKRICFAFDVRPSGADQE